MQKCGRVCRGRATNTRETKWETAGKALILAYEHISNRTRQDNDYTFI